MTAAYEDGDLHWGNSEESGQKQLDLGRILGKSVLPSLHFLPCEMVL